MYSKTDAIILSTRKHRENAIILQMYTKEVGRADFILYGAQSKRNGKRLSFLQPFSVVSVDADIRPNRDLQIVKEIKNLNATSEILFNPYKNTLALFLSEVLSHALRTNEKDVPLFLFLQQSTLYLNQIERGVANFHLAFLVKLTYFLGLQPNIIQSSSSGYFDLLQAEFSDTLPTHNHYLKGTSADFVYQLSRMNYRNLYLFQFTRNERMEILEKILDYYRIHLQGFGEIASLSVLKEVFD